MAVVVAVAVAAAVAASVHHHHPHSHSDPSMGRRLGSVLPDNQCNRVHRLRALSMGST